MQMKLFALSVFLLISTKSNGNKQFFLFESRSQVEYSLLCHKPIVQISLEVFVITRTKSSAVFIYAGNLESIQRKGRKFWGTIKPISLSIFRCVCINCRDLFNGSSSNCIPTTSERMQLDFYSVALQCSLFPDKSFFIAFC